MDDVSDIADELRGVFSILPDGDVRGAIDETLAELGPEDVQRTEFAWADLRPGGGFLRGGLSNALGKSSTVFNTASEHETIWRIVQAAEFDCRPGLISRTDDPDSFVWFLPQMQPEADRQPERFVKAIHVTWTVFEMIIGMFNRDAGLSTAEKRVMFQLTSGMRVREAADQDAVGVETKRTQIKSAKSKMMCGGQTEMVRMAIGQLFYLVSASETAGAPGRFAEDFVAREMPSDCRVMTMRLANGRHVRLLETGSPLGRPVLVLHGILLPMLMMGHGRTFEDLGLRLIVPIKTGYLDLQASQDLMQGTESVETFEDDVLTFVSDMFPAPVPLIGNSLGSISAIRIAARRPELFTELCLVSMHLPDRIGIGSGFSERFHAGIRALSSSPGMLRMLSWQFRKHFANATTVKWSLRRVFEASQSDLDYLDGRHTGRPVTAWYPEFYRNSIHGVAEDFRIALSDWRKDLSNLELPVRLIHGEQDGLTTMSEINRIVGEGPKLALTTIPDAGHLVYATHAERVWKLVLQTA